MRDKKCRIHYVFEYFLWNLSNCFCLEKFSSERTIQKVVGNEKCPWLLLFDQACLSPSYAEFLLPNIPLCLGLNEGSARRFVQIPFFVKSSSNVNKFTSAPYIYSYQFALISNLILFDSLFTTIEHLSQTTQRSLII